MACMAAAVHPGPPIPGRPEPQIMSQIPFLLAKDQVARVLVAGPGSYTAASESTPLQPCKNDPRRTPN